MTEADGISRRNLAPLWLRILTGILIFPFFLLVFSSPLMVAWPAFLKFAAIQALLFVLAAIASWIVAWNLTTRMAGAVSGLALILEIGGVGLWLMEARTVHNKEADIFRQMETADEAWPIPQPEPPLTQIESPAEAPPPPPSTPAQNPLPDFPWPPPTASASYVLPDGLFKGRGTVGDVTGAIITALESNGYVERSFFRTELDGVAMVTRLERINADGSPANGDDRWPTTGQSSEEPIGLIEFLRGLFFVARGHYRVIVFVLQDLPFSQSSKKITGEDARAWLRSGANVLPFAVARRSFAGGHCTVLVYEFASDGSTVRVVESRLTGKQHLEKAGVLSLLKKVN